MTTPRHSAQRPERRNYGDGSESFLVRFAREYGWRAYAIPVLAVITVWVLVDVFLAGPEEGAQGQPGSAVATGSDATSAVRSRGNGPDPASQGAKDLKFTELPVGGPYSQKGEKSYRLIGEPGADAGVGTEEIIRYVVEIENGVDTSAYGGDDAVAKLVDATLTDPRGWSSDERFRFVHVAENDAPTLRIQLSSVETTHEKCGNSDFDMETSCRVRIGEEDTVVLNDSRWARGAIPFEGDLGSYRQYLINHEVGHAIGFAAHVPCGGDGELAPVMMQQTLSLNNQQLHSFAPSEVYPDEDTTCRYNPWPYPQGGAN